MDNLLTEAAPDMLEALKQASIAERDARNFESMHILDDGRLSAKTTAERSESLAAMMRKDAIAKATGQPSPSRP